MDIKARQIDALREREGIVSEIQAIEIEIRRLVALKQQKLQEVLRAEGKQAVLQEMAGEMEK